MPGVMPVQLMFQPHWLTHTSHTSHSRIALMVSSMTILLSGSHHSDEVYRLQPRDHRVLEKTAICTFLKKQQHYN